MGHAIEQIARSRGHEIVSIIDVNNPEEFESEAFRSADVAIEFTAPSVALGNYRKAFAARCAGRVGYDGLARTYARGAGGLPQRSDIFLCLQFQSRREYLFRP